MISDLLLSAGDFIERFGFPVFFGVIGAAIFWKLINSQIDASKTERDELVKLRAHNQALEKRLTECLEKKAELVGVAALESHIKQDAVQDLLDDTQGLSEQLLKLVSDNGELESQVLTLSEQLLTTRLKLENCQTKNSGMINEVEKEFNNDEKD